MEKKSVGKKLLKAILIVIALLVAILAIHTIRNYLIITNMQKRVSQYTNSTNYHLSINTNENNGTIMKLEYYKKDNKEVVFIERKANEETTKLSIYNNGERTDLFTETEDSKIAQLDTGSLMSINIYNLLETDNNWQTLLGSLCSKIRSKEYNGKKCYSISGFMSSTNLNETGEVTYIEKETGLPIRTNVSGIISERSYEFDNVNDSIFVEPDISQYTLK